MTAEFSVDWYSGTKFMTAQFDTYHFAAMKWLKSAKQLMGYTNCYENLETGAMLLHRKSGSENEYHLILSGNAMRLAADFLQVTTSQIADWLWLEGFKPSRIDLSLDLKGSHWIPVAHFAEGINSGAIDIGKRQALVYSPLGKLITNEKQSSYIGSTVYIGAPKSPRRLRIYDKQYEMGTDQAWTRLEFQFRHQAALAVVRLLPKQLLSDSLAAQLAYTMKGDVPDFYPLLASVTEPIRPKDSRPASDTEKWLLHTVAPSLAKALIQTDFAELYRSKLISLGVAQRMAEALTGIGGIIEDGSSDLIESLENMRSNNDIRGN